MKNNYEVSKSFSQNKKNNQKENLTEQDKEIAYLTSENEKLNKALEEMQHYYENIIARMPNNVFWLDTNCILQGGNDNLAKMFGLRSHQELKGLTYEKMAELAQWTEGQGEAFKQAELEVMRTGLPRLDIDEPPVVIDGKTRYYISSKVPLYNTKNEIIGVLGISTDITERKQNEAMLKEAKERAEGADKAKTEFLSIMGHELRKPINNITGLLYLLKSTTNLSEEQSNYIKQANSIAYGILPILQYANEFLKIDEEQYEPYEESYSILRLVESIVKKAFSLNDNPNINYFVDIKNQLPELLIFDVYRFKQVLEIVLVNANRFTSKGYIATLIELNKETKCLRIIVEDTGIGMSQEKIDALFHSRSDKESIEAGLRLSLVKRMIETLRGKIWAESKVNEFTKIYLEIPCKMQATSVASKKVTLSDNLLKNIFLIDDDSVTRSFISRALEYNQIAVKTIADIEAISKAASSKQFDKNYSAIMLNVQHTNLNSLLKDITNYEHAIKLPVLIYGHPTELSNTTRRPSILNVFLLDFPILPGNISQKIHSSMNTKKPVDNRVLVIEDDQLSQKIFIHMLEDLGFYVDAASTGREAINLISNNVYEFAFLDMDLPDTRGTILAPKLLDITKTKNLKDPKIIVVTSYADESLREDIHEYGILAVILKPLSIDNLKTVINELKLRKD